MKRKTVARSIERLPLLETMQVIYGRIASRTGLSPAQVGSVAQRLLRAQMEVAKTASKRSATSLLTLTAVVHERVAEEEKLSLDKVLTLSILLNRATVLGPAEQRIRLGVVPPMGNGNGNGNGKRKRKRA